MRYYLIQKQIFLTSGIIVFVFSSLLLSSKVLAQGTISPTPTLSPTLPTITTETPTITVGDTSTPTPDIKDVETQSFAGQITRIQGSVLSIKTSSETKEVTVPDNIQITKDDKSVSFTDLKVNDNVTISQTTDNRVLSITVSTPKNFIKDNIKIILPIAAAIILLGLLSYLLTRRNRGKIITSTERVG